MPSEPDVPVHGHFSEGLLLSMLHRIGGHERHPARRDRPRARTSEVARRDRRARRTQRAPPRAGRRRAAARRSTVPRPATRSTTAMQRQLIEAFDGASGDAEVRVVVLTAAGDRHFCTGPDLRDPHLAPDPTVARGTPPAVLREGSHRMVRAMLDCEKPIVCGLNGTAAGGGAKSRVRRRSRVAVEHATIIELFADAGSSPTAAPRTYSLGGSRRTSPSSSSSSAEELTMSHAYRLRAGERGGVLRPLRGHRDRMGGPARRRTYTRTQPPNSC